MDTKPTILSKETLITGSLFLAAVSFIVGTVAFIVRGTVVQEQLQLRVQKNEDVDARQDVEIQAVTRESAVLKAELTQSLKNVITSLDELKKSVKEIESQLRNK